MPRPVKPLLRLLRRLGFAAWFGAGLWFGGFAAQALFARLGSSGAAAPLAVLFPSFFAFATGCGLVSLFAAVAGRHGALAVSLSALVLATGLAGAVVLDPLVHAAVPGTPAFLYAHLASVLVGLVGWLAALAGLLLVG